MVLRRLEGVEELGVKDLNHIRKLDWDFKYLEANAQSDISTV